MAAPNQPQPLDISALLHGRGAQTGDPYDDLLQARRAVADAEDALQACLKSRFASFDPCVYTLFVLDGRDKDVTGLYETLVAARAEQQRCYKAAPDHG